MKKKTFILVTAGIIMLGGSATVWADGKMKSINVLFDRINVNMNGQQANLTQDSIRYEGSVYMPLRNLSEMLGANVSWDNETRSVNINFLIDHSTQLNNTARLGVYQYITLENNAIMEALIHSLKTNDTEKMGQLRDRYGALIVVAKNVKDDELSLTFGKLQAAVELLRGGWESKKFDDYSIAWSIYNTNAEKVNRLLKNKLDTTAP